MFGRKSKPSRVYRFGAKVAKEDLPLCIEIIRGAHKYRNNLVELERLRRQRVDQALAELSPRLQVVENEIETVLEGAEDVEEKIRKERQRTGTKRVSVELRKEKMDQAKKLRDLRAERKALRAKLFARKDWKAIEKEIEGDHKNTQKEHRATCNLYHGTYLVVEDARTRDRRGAPPQFKSFEGKGTIATQIQRGGRLADAKAGTKSKLSRFLQIFETADPNAPNWKHARIRVGSEGPGGRIPVWLPFRVKMHREVPADARVKWVKLVARRVGTHYTWSLQLVLSRDKQWERKHTGKGTVAVTMGWAARSDGIRVATWVGTDGQQGDLIIPNEQINRGRKCREIESIRARNFEGIKERLDKMLVKAPEWIQEATSGMLRWHSQQRLASIVIRWRGERWNGDEHAFALAEAWRKQDKHNLEYAANQRQGILDWRKSHYREFASNLAKQFNTAVTPDISWSQLSRVKKIYQEDGTYERVEVDLLGEKVSEAEREYRRLAAVYLLTECIKHAMPLEKIDAKDVTAVCGNCLEDKPCQCNCPVDESKCLNILRRHLPDEELALLFKQRAVNTTLRFVNRGA